MTKQMEFNFSSEARLARAFPWQGSERDWMTLVVTSCLPSWELLKGTIQNGLSGKTCPVSCQVTKDETLEPSLGRWGKSGMGSLTEFSTLNTSEWPKDAAVCSLSGVLETGDVPQRFYLSAKACRGILRRAEKRGKKLPEQLQRALEAVAAVE
jgi:hypothetical protein